MDLVEPGYFGASVPRVETFVEVIPDYYTAACTETAEGQPYLSIAADPQPGDTRALDQIERTASTARSLHTVDHNFSFGDLLSLVETQAAAYDA